MNKTTIMSNIVEKKELRMTQAGTLRKISNYLKNSFGPMGSNTGLKKENALNKYTKDGHTILENIHFHGILEESIKDDLESITRHIVTTVGDGTTSAILMAYSIFCAFNAIEEKENILPAELIKKFNKVVDEIKREIKYSATECTLEDIYDISMISTNGNEWISEQLRDIYKEHGMEVFIDVLAGTDNNSYTKSYDGMTMNTGFNNPCYITNSEKNEAVIDKAHIFYFKDPIDTPQMAGIFDAIISINIMHPYNEYANGKGPIEWIKPTVIIAPKISRDLSSTMNKVTNFMAQMPASERLPLLIISDYHQPEVVDDIAALCGCKPIIKYIDPELLQKDIEAGEAPTPETIINFSGYSERVIANGFKTSFINPEHYSNEDAVYTNLLNYVETSLNKAKEDGEDLHTIGTLKRRLHSLKSNLVEFTIGGIDAADRDALRDLVEDAVLNCRSAAANGVGWGANFSGWIASMKINDRYAENNNDLISIEIINEICNSYDSIMYELYSNLGSERNNIIHTMLKVDQPYNIRTGKYEGVKSSIESDIIILDTVVKIIGIMATCNQFIVPTPMHNVYMEDDK